MKMLKQIAVATDLREGVEGIRAILASVARNRNISLKDLAKTVHMPLPVVAAVRRELERHKLLVRDKGICLTPEGLELVSELGIQGGEASGTCVTSILSELKSKMPGVNVALDQAFATPETSFRRVIYADRHDAISGRNILLVGDDDLTSVAIGLHSKKERKPNRIVVLDIDSRVIDFITSISKKYNLDIECYLHDLKLPLPTNLKYNFSTIFTDPPYTLPGLELFLARASEALEEGPGKQGYLSFGHKDPDSDHEVFKIISRYGFIPKEIIENFNTYDGGTIIGNVSRMIRVVSGTMRASLPAFTDLPIYTGDTNTSRRSYICTLCGEKYKVGKNCLHIHIEALKKMGCSKCGNTRFNLAAKTQEKKNDR